MIHVVGYSAGSVADKQFEVEHFVAVTVANGKRIWIYNDKVEVLPPAGMRGGKETDKPVITIELNS